MSSANRLSLFTGVFCVVLATLELEEDFRTVIPTEPTLTAHWFRENFYNEDGKAFDEYTVPWVTAPFGPCDAFDNPLYREIVLQWAARMFKTQFGQGAQMKTGDLDPCSMMFATSDETSCRQIFGRFWRMLAWCPALRDQCPPERLQSKVHIELDRCQIYGAWAGGKSRLADKAIRVGHANEVDKWEHDSTSTEGDPLPRFKKRHAEFADFKLIIESTPGTKGHSRIERDLVRSTNCRYWVPCPHCAKFAPLAKGDGQEPPGLFWEKKGGKSEPEHARKTAYYVCGYCKGDVRDIHRPEMIGSGVWVPEGCSVDHDKAMRARELEQFDYSWMTGEMAHTGPRWGSQISAMYAMHESWGSFAARWIESQKKPGERRQFINEDLAETWEHVRHKQTWQQLGERLIDNDLPRLMVPSWASLLTIGIDRQGEPVEKFPWVVRAWGAGRRSLVIAYGEAMSLDELRSTVIEQNYQHQDGGEPLRICFGLFDTGFRPDGIYEFCLDCSKRGFQIWPCKGSNKALDSDYSQSQLGPNTSMPGMVLFHVDTIRSQLHLEKQLHALKRTDEGGFAVHAGSLGEHQDYLEQLLNDAAVADLDGHNNTRESWDRINASIPNDFRDGNRYAWVAMLIATRGTDIKPRNVQPEKRNAVVSAGATRPDGRPWV